MPVTVDYSLDQSLSKQAYDLLTQYYLHTDEKSPQDGFARAAIAFSNNDHGLAQRIYKYSAMGWFMFASPVLSNAPMAGGKPQGMPISCFLSHVPDTRDGLVKHRSETAWLTFMGGGVGGHWSSIRAVSKKSNGPIPHIRVIDSQMLSDSQGKTRRGSYAAYLDISSPDILEFLETRLKTGGDPNRKCFNIHTAVNVPNAFMEAVAKDGDWDLICPHSNTVFETVRARKLWKRVLECRFQDGEAYINYIDHANNALHPALKARGLKIRGSNLCNEIHLPTDDDRTAVCCLSSLNLEKYDEWKDTTIVADLIRYLDNVLQFFIDHAPDEIARAKYSARRERSLGLGFMGFHSLLQSKNIPFESEEARRLNKDIFSKCHALAHAETLKLARERGEALDLECEMVVTFDSGQEWIVNSSDLLSPENKTQIRAFDLEVGDEFIHNVTNKAMSVVKISKPEWHKPARNSHLFAIAPNANSSIITGCSPSIEPWAANAFVHRHRGGSDNIKNKYLDDIIKNRFPIEMVDTIWSEIVAAKGSIQNNDRFTDHEKRVFKTAFELDQRWVVTHAAERQPYICQGQSLNLFFPFGAPAKHVHEVHYMAWQMGLKGLYYLRTEAGKRADGIGTRIERRALGDAVQAEATQDLCVACQG